MKDIKGDFLMVLVCSYVINLSKNKLPGVSVNLSMDETIKPGLPGMEKDAIV
jgi:hypothetical protein